MFATIWYAGAVVMWLGFQGMSYEDCQDIKRQMETDIQNSYTDPVTAKELIRRGFVYEKWDVTCEQRKPVSRV